MRIGIDATCWANPRGYGRYARGLLSAVLERNREHDYVLFVDQHVRDTCALPDSAEIVVVSTGESQSSAASATSSRSPRDMLAMGAAVSRTPLDVFLYPSVYTYFPVWTRAIKIVGVHDVIPERFPALVFPERKARMLWNIKHWVARQQADYLLTVSDYARDGIVDVFKWDKSRIFVVGEAPDPVFKPASADEVSAAREKYGIPADARYVMFLGGLNPHKNLAVLVDAFAMLRRGGNTADPALLNVHLVLAGPAETDLFTPGVRALRERIAALDLAEAVHVTGFVPDETAAALMTGARALVLPSLEEGFGLPAVEAAACGTPVIATNRSPLPQLLGDGGLYFNPLASDVTLFLQNALCTLLRDNSQYQTMARVALERSRALTWNRAADAFEFMLTTAASEKKHH